jgi:hypothetical protein
MNMKQMMNRTLMSAAILAATALAGTLLGGCEDAPPNDYVPQYVVTGYLLVDRPIADIVLTRSQSLTDTFKVRKGLVPDATVRVKADGASYDLVYRASEGGTGDYYLPDTTIKVRPKTMYTLEITTKDGSTMTAQTVTPDRFAWTQAPRDTVKIPAKKDPAYLNPPDSLDLAWTNTAGVTEHLVEVRALDTAEYGKYVTPTTDQKNRRIDPDLDEQDQLHYNDLARWGFVPSTTTPIVWAAFKWYGPQVVSIYAADRNFVNWFKMTQWTGNAQFDPLLGNVRGEGIGIFGSASVISARDFVVMTTP